jgi:hypothetical protein
MTSTAATTEPLDTSPTPDLLPLYPPYLAAFNAHSWPDILKYLSPTSHATIRGKIMNTSAEEMRPNYEKDFARCDKHEIVAKDMTPIERGADVGPEGAEKWKKEIRWGLRLVLYDPVMGRTLTVNYWYRVEDGKWMQCWHEILDSVADEAA